MRLSVGHDTARIGSLHVRNNFTCQMRGSGGAKGFHFDGDLRENGHGEKLGTVIWRGRHVLSGSLQKKASGMISELLEWSIFTRQMMKSFFLM